MRAPVRGLLLAVLCVTALLPLGCKSGPKIPTNSDFDPDALYQTYIMGVPMLHADFATSGQFDLAVIGLTFNENVYWADANNSSLILTTPTKGYTATIQSVVRRVPTLSQLSAQIVMDGSGSMSSSDPDMVRAAAGNLFISKLKKRNPAHRVAVAEFSRDDIDADSYYFHLWKDFTAVTDSAGFTQAFSSLSAVSLTPLYTAIRRGIQHTDSTVSAASYNRSVIAFTDGWENDSYPQDSLMAVASYAAARGIPVYIVGLGAVDVPSMIRLAGYSGGVYAQANVPNDLKGIFAVIAVSLTQGYNVITFKFDTVPPSGTNLRYTFRMKQGDNVTARYIDFTIP